MCYQIGGLFSSFFLILHRSHEVLYLSLTNLQGFPSAGVEGYYRNRASDVAAFFKQRHGEKSVWVFNLCSERQYDASLFDDT